MKREEAVIVDLKVKDYDIIKLKQLDTTKLTFKILDNSTEVALNGKTARIIFKKPNRTSCYTKLSDYRKFSTSRINAGLC